jgi:hypothetical protein
MDYEEAYFTCQSCEPNIKIHNENECGICGNYYKYDWGFKPLDNGLYEARVLTEHPRCRQLKNRLEKLKREVLDCEFELFCKKFNTIKYK